MNIQDELNVSTGETLNQPAAQMSPAELVKNFKLAVTILLGISVLIRILMHFTVPGM